MMLFSSPASSLSSSSSFSSTNSSTVDTLPFRSLFLGDLSSFCTEMDIVNHFQRYGIIEEIKIMKGKDNKALGYGFLVFLDPESAVRAKELDGTIFLGRTLK